MGPEKPKNDDKQQNTEEIGCQSSSNEAVCSTEITGTGTVDVPSNRLEVLTLDVGVNTEAGSKNNEGDTNTQLNTYHTRSGYGSSVPPAFEMAQGGSSDPKRPSIELDASDSSKVNAFPGSATSVDGVVRHPSTMQDASLSQMSPFPQSRVPYQGFHGISGASSSGENFGGRPSIVQNASESSDWTAFPSTTQKASGPQMLPHPQSHVPYSFLTQGHQKSGARFANIDPYRGFHGISGASSNRENFGGHNPSMVQNASRSNNSTEFPGSAHSVDSAVGNPNIMQNATLPQMSPIPQSHPPYDFLAQCYQKFGGDYSGIVPDRGFHGISGASSNRENFGWVQNASESSNLTSFPSSMQNVSPPQMLPNYQSHVLYPFLTQGHQNFGTGSSNIVPNQGVHGFYGTSSSQEHLRSRSRWPPNQSFHALSGMSSPPVQEQRRLTPLPSFSSVASSQQQMHNRVSIPNSQRGAFVAPVVGNVERNNSQSWRNAPAISSNHLSRSYLKRGASQPPHSTPQVQKKRTTNRSSYPSVAYPVSSVPPVRVTTPSIRATTIPVSVRTVQSPYIQREAEDPFQPIGYNCLLCKRDLAYQPEGPISPSAALPVVTVFSCGHSYHDLCLQRMTHEDLANDPPCIQCAIGED